MVDMNALINKKLALAINIKALTAEEDSVKAEIKLGMRELKTDKYEDDAGNIVTLREQTRESLNKARVKELLGEIKFTEVVKKSTFEVLKVISAESREASKSYIG